MHSHGATALAGFYPADGRVRMEGTTQHIYADTALQQFRGSPHTRLLIMLREPAARILSLYRYVAEHQCNLEGVSFPCYVDYLLTGEIEALRHHFANQSAYFALRDALHHTVYGFWLERWRPELDEGRLRVMLFEEYRADPRRVLKVTSSWLGIDPKFYDTYQPERSNVTHTTRFRSLHRFVRCQGGRLPAGMKPAWAVGLYRRLQAAPREDTGEEKALQRLREYFRPMTVQVASEYHLPVTEWWGA